MRIVLDTNVLVSAFHSNLGNPARVLRLLLDGRHTLVVDARIVDEYREVLSRPGWPFRIEDALTVLDVLIEEAVEIEAPPLHLHLPDPDDSCFIEVARAGGGILVTGNRRHFPRGAVGETGVLSPKEFLDLIAEGGGE